jgi:hypothetical protein
MTWVRDQVEVPARMLRVATLARHQGVLPLVLDAHEPDLAHLAALGTDHRDDDDRHPGVPQGVAPCAARGFVLGHLLSDPGRRARLILSGDGHLGTPCSARGEALCGIRCARYWTIAPVLAFDCGPAPALLTPRTTKEYLTFDCSGAT